MRRILWKGHLNRKVLFWLTANGTGGYMHLLLCIRESNILFGLGGPSDVSRRKLSVFTLPRWKSMDFGWRAYHVVFSWIQLGTAVGESGWKPYGLSDLRKRGTCLFHSKDNKKLIIYYSASGCWSPYYCIGMLTCDAGADLLNPKSWTKATEPVFYQSPQDSIWGPGSPSFIPSPDSTEWYILYTARNIPNGITGESESRSPRLQKITWDKITCRY